MSSSTSSSVFITSSSSSLCSRDWACSMPWPNIPPSLSSRASRAPSSSCSAPSRIPPAPPPPSSSATAESLKLQGNAAFKSGDFPAALSLYDQALSLFPNDILLLSNRAAALTSLSLHSAALSACAVSLSQCSLQSAPPSVVAKVYRRKAFAHLKLRQLADAHGAYKHAQEKAKDEETERLMKKLESESSDLVFSYAQKFYLCRKEIERKWKSLKNLSIERIAPVDLVETSNNVFEPGMRQRDLSGAVVQDINSLNEVGAAAIPVFKSLLTDVLAAVGLPVDYLHMAPLKGAERAVEKARDDYDKRVDGPGLSWLFDMVRGSVICEEPEEVERVIEHLVARGCVVRLKNRFKTPTPGGFRDFNLNIRVTLPSTRGRPDAIHICELQVHIKELKEFGKEIGSHDVYDFFRKYFAGGTEAVEERLRLMDAVFGDQDVGGIAGGFAASGQRATSLKGFVDQVCNEGDVHRMRTTAELVTLLCEHDLSEKINRALIERKGADSQGIKTLKAMFDLAETKRQQGKLVEALEMLDEVLLGCTRAFGPDHTSTVTTMNNIGNVLCGMGKYKEALEMYEKALAGYARAFGPDHASVLGTMGNIGNMLTDKGKYKEALEMYEKALAGETRALGPGHTSTLTTMNNIGNVLRNMGKYKEALEMYEKALLGYTRALGPDHTSTLASIGNIGNVLDDMGKHKEALEMYEKALAGKTRALGPYHTSTLDTMSNIGNVLDTMGKHKEALEMYEKALEGKTRALGPDHTSLLGTMSNIGNVLGSMGKHKEALEMYEKALAGYTRALGPDHMSTLDTMENIALLLETQGNLQEAILIEEKVVAGRIKVLGAEHPFSVKAQRFCAYLASQLATPTGL